MSREEPQRDPAHEDPVASGDTSDHEVDPADDPGPRGNPEVDPERVDRGEEDLDRTVPS